MTRSIPPAFTPAPDGQSYGLSPGAVLWQSALTAYAPLGSYHGSDTAEGRGKARQFVTSMLTAASEAGMLNQDVRQLQDVAARAALSTDTGVLRELLGHCERAAAHLSRERLRELLAAFDKV